MVQKSAAVDYRKGRMRADTRKLDAEAVRLNTEVVSTQTDVTTLQTDKADLGEGEINAQTGTAYTLVLTDKGKLVTMSNASANTLTVPPNSSVAFPTGSEVHWAQIGAGTTTIVAGSGVTISALDAVLTSLGQYAGGTLKKTATNTWLALGGLG